MLKIISADWHRNGICGVGFYAIIFDDPDNGRMVASLFDEPGYCAVYKIDALVNGNVGFARGNSWRGDQYESALRPLLDEFMKANEVSRFGPWSIPPADVLEKSSPRGPRGRRKEVRQGRRLTHPRKPTTKEE